jgi:hypothetical protein
MKFEGFSTERSSPVEIITTGADTLPKDVLETIAPDLYLGEDIFQ